MHELNIDEGEVIIFQEKGLVPHKFKALLDNGVNCILIVDSDLYVVLQRVPGPLRLYAGINESDHDHWMQSQNT